MPIQGIKINDPGVVISCLRRNGSMNRQGSRRRDPGHQEVTDNLASSSNQSGHALNGTNRPSEWAKNIVHCACGKSRWLLCRGSDSTIRFENLEVFDVLLLIKW